MRKLLGIVASYRKVGNSEIVVKAVAGQMGDGWELGLIRLPQLNILPCRGCYACLQPGKSCRIADDMAWLLEQIAQADAVILAAPDYVLGPVGIVKMLTDRGIQAAAYLPQFQEKRTAVVLTLGREDYRGYADTALLSQVAALGLKVVIHDYFYGTHPGEVGLSPDFDNKIKHLSGALTNPEYQQEAEPGRCPRCGSDLFRLRPEGWECAICKSLAKLENGGLSFFYFHPAFTLEGQLEHLKWLLGKKEEYPSIKAKLAQIQDQYREGRWLTP